MKNEPKNEKEQMKKVVKVLMEGYSYDATVVSKGTLLKVPKKNKWWYGDEYLFLTAPNGEGGLKSGFWWGWRFSIGKRGTILHGRVSDMWREPSDYIRIGYQKIDVSKWINYYFYGGE